MTRVAGPSLAQLDRLGDDYAGLVAETLARTARAALQSGVPQVEDLARVRTAWAAWADETLLPALGVAFEVGAAQVRVGLREALETTNRPVPLEVEAEDATDVGLTAAAFTGQEEEAGNDGTNPAQPGGD